MAFWKAEAPWPGLAFVGGVALAQAFAVLPPPWWSAAAALWAILWWRWPRLAVLWALAIGLSWAVAWGHWRLAHALPVELAGEDLTVVGRVASIPEPRERSIRFEFVISGREAAGSTPVLPVPLKVRLSWYRFGDAEPPALHAGEQWRLKVRLKPARGMQNPGGFDYEAWLFSRGLRATGYVRADPVNALQDGPGLHYPVSQLRQALLAGFKHLTAGLSRGAILQALALGYRNDISGEDWALLTGTGTNHLMAVSGLHIGLVAGLVYAFVLWCVRARRLAGRSPPDAGPAQRAAALAALAAAALYALLAGFSLPTRRALIMLSVGLAGVLAYRQLRPAHALVTALVVVVALDPFAVNTPGFWLSFGAVGVLVYTYAGRRGERRSGWLRAAATWGRVQWLLVLGLLPLTVFWFGAAAVTAAGANLIAIPLVGFVVVPLALSATALMTLWPAAAGVLLQWADGALQLLWPVLQVMSQWPLARWEQSPPPLWTLFPAAVGVALLLAPRGWPGRWLGIGWLAPLLLIQPPAPPHGTAGVTVLDVGQGTAVVVRTAGHVLVYDAGPRTSERFDTGALVVLPYLRSQGIARIDTLLVSHGDNDHIGGARAVLERLPVGRVLTAVPGRFGPDLVSPATGRGVPVKACRSGQRWRWDGVDFEILHPPGGTGWRGNNASCVLRVGAGRTRALFGGDIEKQAERQLLRRGAPGPADLVIVPHHGSRTSSTPAFVRALAPRHAVFTAGLFNRYGFPKPDVLARYRRIGASTWVTGEHGALSFELTPDGPGTVSAWRRSHSRYWHYRPQAPDP